VGPASLFAAMLATEVIYWWLLARPRLALEDRLRQISPLTFYLVPTPYLIRFMIIAAYIAITGAPVLAGLVANLPAGLAVGIALAGAQLPILIRVPPAWPAAPRERLEVVIFLGYALFAIALVEELIFRGALLLALGDGLVALVGSSVAMAAWHVPYYVTTLGVTRLDRLARSMALITTVSLVFGVAVTATGSLWSSIIPHGSGDFLGHLPRRRLHQPVASDDD